MTFNSLPLLPLGGGLIPALLHGPQAELSFALGTRLDPFAGPMCDDDRALTEVAGSETPALAGK